MKTYFAKSIGVDPENICTVSIMPCLAKKGERNMELFYEEYAGHDVDVVLTTRELVRMIRSAHIAPSTLVDAPCDSLIRMVPAPASSSWGNRRCDGSSAPLCILPRNRKEPGCRRFLYCPKQQLKSRRCLCRDPDRRHGCKSGCRQRTWQCQTADRDDRARRCPL